MSDERDNNILPVFMFGEKLRDTSNTRQIQKLATHVGQLITLRDEIGGTVQVKIISLDPDKIVVG